METKETSLLKGILRVNGTQYIIPDYQRKYSWVTKQCKRLYDDIKSLNNKTNIKKHFLGTIVAIFHEEELEKISYLLIDGQQRILTFAILIKAFFDVIIHRMDEFFSDKENEINSIRNNISAYLFNSTPLDELKIENPNFFEKKIIILPIETEKRIFIKMMNPFFSFLNNDFSDYDKNNNIYRNYSTFYGYFESLFKKITSFDNFNKVKNDFLEKLSRVNIISIILNKNEENPQKIFESINSTGMNLTAADLIKNFILMNENFANQKYFFNKYWLEIESGLDNKNLNEVISNFLCLKTGKKSSDKNLYDDFKKEAEPVEKETLLKELLNISKLYKKINVNNDKNKELFKINKFSLKMGQFYPLIIVTLDLLERKIIEIDEFNNLIKLYINYFIRRSLFNFQTGSFANLLYSIAKFAYLKYSKIERLEKNEFYNDILSQILETTSKGFFPGNDKLIDVDAWKDFYNYANPKFILIEIEKSFSSDSLKDDNYTLEHIMPQTLNPDWKEDLGSDFKRIHDTFKDDIGNLTLVANNSEIGNKRFSDKKVYYEKSRFKLTEMLLSYENWGESSIINRREELINLFFNVFPFPEPMAMTKPIKNKSNIKQEYIIQEELSFSLKDLRDKGFEIINKNVLPSRIIIGNKNSFSPNKIYDILPKTFDILINSYGVDIFLLNSYQDEIDLEYDLIKRVDELEGSEIQSEFLPLSNKPETKWFVKKEENFETVLDILESIFNNIEYSKETGILEMMFIFYGKEDIKDKWIITQSQNELGESNEN